MDMVKLTNQFGDLYSGKQGLAVYQLRCGKKNYRRKKEVKKSQPSPQQKKRKENFVKMNKLWKQLEQEELDFLQQLAEANNLTKRAVLTKLVMTTSTLNVVVEDVDNNIYSYDIYHPAIVDILKEDGTVIASALSSLFEHNLTQVYRVSLNEIFKPGKLIVRTFGNVEWKVYNYLTKELVEETFCLG